MKQTVIRFTAVLALAALVLSVVVWRANVSKPAVTIVFVGRGDEEWIASDAVFDAVAKAWHSLPGHEEDKIEYIKTGIRLNTTVERDTILAQMIYGEGVIYLADAELVKEILADDALFLPLPTECEAAVFDSAGRGIGVRLNTIPALADYELPDSFCYFVRTEITQDKALSSYIEKNQEPAMEVLFRLMK